MARFDFPSLTDAVPRSVPGDGFAPGDQVVWLSGEHDASTVAALIETIATTMAAGEADLVVDLSGVTFMGTAAVEVILRSREVLRLDARTIVLRSPSPCARRILSLCGLETLLEPDAAARPMGRAVSALASWVPVPVTARDHEPAALAAPPARTTEVPHVDPNGHLAGLAANLALGRGGD